MQITIIDLMIAWFSKVWEKIDDLKKTNNFVLQMYIAGVISALLLYPSFYLISYVYGLDILGKGNIRFYIAVCLTGVLFYMYGGAVSIFAYRRQESKKKNGGKSES